MRARTGGYSIEDFALVVDEVSLGDGLPTAKIVRPESEDAVLDMYVELGLLDHDPYWAALWPSSVALARGVAERARGEGGDLRGKNVCDMGAGLGLAGIAAALCGARSVTFYDREPLALQCCLLSADRYACAWRSRTDASVEATRAARRAGRKGRRTLERRAARPRRKRSRKKQKTDAITTSTSRTSPRRRSIGTPFLRTNVCSTSCSRATCCTISAVAPVASLVGTLTEKKNGVWLVADPPLRAPKNRARFLELVDAGGFGTTSATRRTKVTHAGSTDIVLLLELRAKA